MNNWLKKLSEWFGRPHLVEFEYRDSTGPHHGRVYVSGLFANDQRVRRMLSSCGYTKIHIA